MLKYKVAPMSQQTIPKLMLQCVVLANGLAKTTRTEFKYEIEEIHFWTDSIVVLQQIRFESRRFFVACRLGEIQQDTNISQLHWMNVADQDAKETKNCELSTVSKWFSGHTFLKLPEEICSVEPNCSNEPEQILIVRLNDAQPLQMEYPVMSRFSKFNTHLLYCLYLAFQKLNQNSKTIKTR